MKRRISKTAHTDPSPIGGATLPQRGGLRGIRSSDFRNSNPTSQSTKDMSCRKRVKLTDLDVNIPLSCRINASSTALEGRQSPRSDDSKTSEFAFKKLKENAGCKYQSHTMHIEENQSMKFKISDCSVNKCSEMHLNYNLGLFKTPAVPNLAVRTSVANCLLKTLHLITLAHSSHLLVVH